jgi:predicted RNA binding protein YcfA (HicA-like mRNA interferase family)
MPKLYSSEEIRKVLQKIGFQIISQKGSHGKFRNTIGRTVILPMSKKEIPIGTFRSVLRQAGIDLTTFEKNI